MRAEEKGKFWSHLGFGLRAGAAEGAHAGTASPGEGGFGGGHVCGF